MAQLEIAQQRGEGSSSASMISNQPETSLDRKIKDNKQNFEALSQVLVAWPRIPVIKRVPNMLREENEKDYTPSVVSIGPLHRGKGFLQAIEADKVSYMRSLFRRPGIDYELQTRKACVAAMSKMKNTLRTCYADQFVKMDENVIPNLIEKMRSTLTTCYPDQVRLDEHVITNLVEMAQNTFSRTCCPEQVNLNENLITDLVEVVLNSLRTWCQGEPVSAVTNIIEERLQNTLKNQDENVITNLIEMMLIDGGFVIELVYKHHKNENDPILSSHFWWSAIRRDLLLLENQIPFVALEKLFSLTVQQIPADASNRNIQSSSPTLIDCLLSFFGDIMGSEYTTSDMGLKGVVPPLHILHLLHISYQPSPVPVSQDQPVGHQGTATQPHNNNNNAAAAAGFREEQTGGDQCTATQQRVLLSANLCFCGFHCSLICSQRPSDQPAGYQGTATQLHNEGIKLRKRKKTGKLFDVEFKPHDSYVCFWRARLEIPCFSVYHSTESFLRNVIAFEQCYPFVDTRFSSHAFLMDVLMDSVEDVKLFENAGVIRNHLGTSESVLQMFHGICKNAAGPRHFHYHNQWRQMNGFRTRWREQLAIVRRNCAGNLWIVLTVMGATALFVLTLLQTIYTMQS